MRTAVAFIIFNRPEVTARVFAEIARARPPKLFVIADGPRADRPGEAEACAATRAIIDRVDWPCELFTNYSDVNMGCGHRPYTGIRWVFEHVDEAIILEDDCLPQPTFFRFCEELLERYRDDERVMLISGDCFHAGVEQLAFSYSFSCYSLTWGWASWRRAFQHYDRQMRLWPMLRRTGWLREILGDDTETLDEWYAILERAHAAGDSASYWAYQWLFTIWTQRGLSILPNTNLISNIGYDGNATHTTVIGDPRANLTVGEMTFPLNHPSFIFRDREVDRVTFDRVVRSNRRLNPYQLLRNALADALPADARKAISSVKQRLGPLSRI